MPGHNPDEIRRYNETFGLSADQINKVLSEVYRDHTLEECNELVRQWSNLIHKEKEVNKNVPE